MKLSCYFASLGCDKNLVDTEKMMAYLGENEVIFTDDENEADIIVINTCSFILDAKQESIETILELSEQKRSGNCKVLVVTGCLAERYSKEIREEIPEVDAVVGTSAYDSIWEAVSRTLEGEKPDILKDLSYTPASIARVNTQAGPTGYLKIAEGCDKRCTYCIIPSLRGPYRSTPMKSLVDEARALADRGVKELILVAQETTLYGVDIYGHKALPELLKKLCKIDGLEWIRLMYCYPEEITEELIQTMHDEPKICHYLDLPIQHCNDDILRRMGRRTSHDDIVEKIDMIRSLLPDVTLRTTLISGFPGETEENHSELLEFVRKIRFDRLGVFPYSEEEGTPAADFPDMIDEQIRQDRADDLMKAQADVIFDKNKSAVKKIFSVMVEGYLPEDECYVGRTYMDAPDIDGYVFFTSDDQHMSGDIVTVRINEAREYDLIGERFVN